MNPFFIVGPTATGKSEIAAEIAVDFHGIRFQLTTRNPKRRPDYMAILLVRGPFRSFEGEWRLVHRHANRLEERYEPSRVLKEPHEQD